MFQNYTEAARRALVFSWFQAGRSGASEIGAVHLLLGLLQTRSALAGRLLGHIERGDVWPAIQPQTSGAGSAPAAANLPFADTAMRALKQAANYAARLRRPSVGVEHLVLGLLSDSTIAAMLEPSGVRLADVLARVETQAQQPIRFTVGASPDPDLTVAAYDPAVYPAFADMLVRWPLVGSAEPAAVLTNHASQRITAVVARWTMEDAEGSATNRKMVRDRPESSAGIAWTLTPDQRAERHRGAGNSRTPDEIPASDDFRHDTFRGLVDVHGGLTNYGADHSPGTSDFGTGRSSIGHTGSPVARSRTKMNPCSVSWATALIGRPSTVMSARMGAVGGSKSQRSWCVNWKCQTRLPVCASSATIEFA
jgi:hypothetical protein